MFEKEADEYAEKVYGNRTEVDHYGIADAFLEGAEFGYNKALEEATHNYNAIIADYDKRIAELEAQIEKMKKYIKACWVEENLNDYSSYITNTSDEFRDLVKELNAEVRNGR